MSVNERTDIDYKGTEQITDSKRGIGKALAHGDGDGHRLSEYDWKLIREFRREFKEKVLA